MERRRFLNIVSFGAVGAAAPAAVVAASQQRPPSDFDKEGPICSETLQLRGGTKFKKQESNPNSPYIFSIEQYDEYKQVSFSVGRDGNLWIKNDAGVWKRVVTE